MSHIIIKCAVCKKPVDRYDIRFSNFRNGQEVEAHCHGAIDHCFVSSHFLQEALKPITEGVAFVPMFLESARKDDAA